MANNAGAIDWSDIAKSIEKFGESLAAFTPVVKGMESSISHAHAQAQEDFQLLVSNGIDPQVAAEAIQNAGPLFSHVYDPTTFQTHIHLIGQGKFTVSDLELHDHQQESIRMNEIDVVQAMPRYVEIPD